MTAETPIAASTGDVAQLRARCEELEAEIPTCQIRAVRHAVAQIFLRGRGIEVGAGAFPFPLHRDAFAAYGDVRDLQGLRDYFGVADVAVTTTIDAQTFDGIRDRTQDFVVAAHVIEHLWDPIGAIREGLRVLRPGGVFVIAVPDMRLTFDADRPETTVEHVLADVVDGGAGTRLGAYREHYRYVQPRFGATMSDEEIDEKLRGLGPPWPDIHVHAWTREGFAALLEAASRVSPFSVDAAISNLHENIFVLRRPRSGSWWRRIVDGGRRSLPRYISQFLEIR